MTWTIGRAAPRACAMPLVLALLTLSACAWPGGGPTLPPDAAARLGREPPVKTALDYRSVCLLPAGKQKSEAVGRALREGFERAGTSVKTLSEGEGPQACAFVLAYEMAVSGTVVEGVRLTPFEFGVPKAGASVRAKPGSSGLTEEELTSSAERYAKVLQDKAGTAASPAAFIDPNAPRRLDAGGDRFTIPTES